MRVAPIVLGLCMLVLLAVPIGARLKAGRERAAIADGTPTLVVITPHIEQIRFEFGRAFEAWHMRTQGTAARIDWRSPGGTSDIRKQLESQASAAVSAGAFSLREARKLKAPARGETAPLIEAVIDPKRADLPDVFMGGGSFEHNAVRSGLVMRVSVNGTPTEVRVRLTAPPVGDTPNSEGLAKRFWTQLSARTKWGSSGCTTRISSGSGRRSRASESSSIAISFKSLACLSRRALPSWATRSWPVGWRSLTPVRAGVWRRCTTRS